MQHTGKHVTSEELKHVQLAHSVSGMWGSGGEPFSDPAFEVRQLATKYGMPNDYGLDLRTGEFISPEMPEDPYESIEYERFVQSMVKHCHCEPFERRPCDGVLAGGLCDGHVEDREDEGLLDDPNDYGDST